jgi:hypothetical protein
LTRLRRKRPYRIHRDASPPRDARFEIESAGRHPHRFILFDRGVSYLAAYRRGRKYRIPDDADVAWKRDVFCLIRVKREIVGALHFFEFDVTPFTDNETFLDAMDADAAADFNLAKVICKQWDEVEDVTSYGSILEFRMAWMTPRFARASIWAKAANQIIEREFSGYSILILKAFPLEYEGRAAAGTRLGRGLRIRQAAMKRQYKRLLGVEPFPSAAGREGWLWRPHPRLIGIVKATRG